MERESIRDALARFASAVQCEHQINLAIEKLSDAIEAEVDRQVREHEKNPQFHGRE